MSKCVKRLDGWKSAFMSRGGRLNLIQSILSSILVYYLSLFRIPKNVAGSIEKLMRDFCGREQIGWGLIIWYLGKKSVNLEVVVVWVVKSRYEVVDGQWDTGGGGRLSVHGPWRDISALYEEYRRMVCFKVGKGDRIQFWEDVWLGDDSLKSQFPDLFLVSMAKNCVIKDLAVLDGEGSVGAIGWKFRFRKNLFDREVSIFALLLHMLQVVALLSILEDRRNSIPDTSGVFNCKSAFHFLTYAHLGPELDWAKNLWRSFAPYKVKLFGWLLFLDKGLLVYAFFLFSPVPVPFGGRSEGGTFVAEYCFGDFLGNLAGDE
ncbi:uncharacterized protein LOC133780066 [Humulus lupulus]|uniref:uncharacterized protein LOC133780066 n=1 Tax=Humulus lupulus TaxID=3486 RepID=UPI002B40D5FE|nr:uncharacterized protein LOC133780066 [Humulus lupulus]